MEWVVTLDIVSLIWLKSFYLFQIKKSKIKFILLFWGNLYTNIESWPDIESLPVELGEIGGIALTNADNELVIFHRGSRKWELKQD
jgi:hypothetical protein